MVASGKTPQRWRLILKKVKDEKKKIDVLYSQLQFHHVVLNSKAPKSYFFQKNHAQKRGKKSELSSRELYKHLTEIIKLNIDEHDIEQDLSDLTAIVDAPKEQPVNAASVNVRNDEFEAQKVKLFEKLKEARVKRESKSRGHSTFLSNGRNLVTSHFKVANT